MTRLQAAWRAIRHVNRHALWAALLREVRSRTVRFFQAIMYTCFFLNGVYSSFFSAPASIVDDALGDIAYDGWAWMNMLCPAMVLIGFLLPHLITDSADQREIKKNGLTLQFGGDIGMWVTLSSYWISVLLASWWGRGTPSLFGYVGLSLCALLLAIGDAMEWWALRKEDRA